MVLGILSASPIAQIVETLLDFTNAMTVLVQRVLCCADCIIKLHQAFSLHHVEVSMHPFSLCQLKNECLTFLSSGRDGTGTMVCKI